MNKSMKKCETTTARSNNWKAKVRLGAFALCGLVLMTVVSGCTGDDGNSRSGRGKEGSGCASAVGAGVGAAAGVGAGSALGGVGIVMCGTGIGIPVGVVCCILGGAGAVIGHNVGRAIDSSGR